MHENKTLNYNQPSPPSPIHKPRSGLQFLTLQHASPNFGIQALVTCQFSPSK